MRKLAVTLGLLSLVAAPLAAGGIGVGFGTWDTDTADDDQGAVVKVEVDLGPALDFEMRASFFDAFEQSAGGFLYEIEASPVDLGVNYDFLSGGKIHPYVGGGGSFVFIKPNPAAGQETTSRPRSQEEFGWYAVAGVEFAVAPSFAIFAEAIYRDVSGEVRGVQLGTAPANDFEVDFGGTAASVGVMFTW